MLDFNCLAVVCLSKTQLKRIETKFYAHQKSIIFPAILLSIKFFKETKNDRISIFKINRTKKILIFLGFQQVSSARHSRSQRTTTIREWRRCWNAMHSWSTSWYDDTLTLGGSKLLQWARVRQWIPTSAHTQKQGEHQSYLSLLSLLFCVSYFFVFCFRLNKSFIQWGYTHLTKTLRATE